MKKLISILLSYLCLQFIFQCTEAVKTYEVKLHTPSKSKSETIKAKNDLEAYDKAYTSYQIGRGVVEGMNNKYLEQYTGFDVYDSEQKNIVYSISQKSKDSIEKLVDKLTDNIATNLSKTISNAERPKNTKIDSLEIKRLKPLFTEKKDDFEKSSWVQPKARPIYSNQNGAYCYFSKTDSGAENLRFKMQYAAEDWLFVENVRFNIDGEIIDYYTGKWETDHDSKIWEWSDEQVDVVSYITLKKIANAKTVKYRLNGSQYYKDKTLSQSAIKSIKNTLAYYEALGGKI